MSWPSDEFTAAADWCARFAWPDAGRGVRLADSAHEYAWLDGGAAAGGFSLLCRDPEMVVEQPVHGPARVVRSGRTTREHASFWDLWAEAARPQSASGEPLPVRRLAGPSLDPLAPGPLEPPLTPGWIGYCGSELAGQLERLPGLRVNELGLPVGRMALYTRGIVLDHGRREAWYVGEADESAVRDWERAAKGGLPGGAVPDGRQHGSPAGRLGAPRLVDAPDPGEHVRMVNRALEYIRAGDIYQVNLAQRFLLEDCPDPISVFRAARARNPAAYRALLCWPGGAIVSLSPELFLQLRGGRVLTCPIKGTRPRTGDPARDEAAVRQLLASAKEAAELAMIVDLHRNDLGRVCVPGSVRVETARRVEAQAGVFHTLADVTGRLAEGRDAIDLLAACFPAGSISGVPKIRALEIIRELEPVARGAYTGAIGVLGLDGQMTFNVAIRTLQMAGASATLHVGGGIVAESRPEAEFQEMLDKARAILGSLGVRWP